MEIASPDGVPPMTATLERQGSEKGNGELTPSQRARAAVFEASDELQELCRENGVSGNQFARRGASVTTLDMFLGFWASMKSVMYFPALRELSIVKHPTVTAMEGIEQCPNLEALCITECGLERIANLQNCTRLRKLNLSCNRIRRIEHLESLTQLEVLWLNDNEIESLAGLWTLTRLQQLWACRNRIERLDSALSCCTSLTELNLADNRLCSFKSLLSLTSLEQLRVLTLSDPHFGDNPVCQLCNYQTYIMCYLSRLVHLDTVELSTRNKQIAEATMIKKKMYYNMRIKAIKRDIRARIKHSDAVRGAAEQQLELRLAALVREKKEIERYLADLALRDARVSSDTSGGIGDSPSGGSDSGKPVDCQAVQELKKKLKCIEQCLKTKYSAICRMNFEFERLRTSLQATSDISISRLQLELETGGNIRLEDGKPSDAWFVSCVDLVRSRLFATELRAFGVQDIRINRVTRINNRYLRHRFHARMDNVVTVPTQTLKDNVSKKGVTVPVREPEDPSTDASRDKLLADRLNAAVADVPADSTASDPSAALENSLEYLFYAQPPHFDYQRRAHELEQFVVAESGFRDPSEYARMGVDGAIRLVNSVALLDAPRLAAALTVKGKLLQRQQTSPQEIYRLASLPPHRQRELTSDMRAALQLAVSGDWELPSGVLLVVKVFPGYTKTLAADEKQSGVTPADSVHAQDYPGLQSVQVPCTPPPPLLAGAVAAAMADAAAKQKHYYMFDKALVLPEYLVEYQYTLTESVSSAAAAAAAVGSGDSHHPQSADAIKSPRSVSSSNDAEVIDLGVAAKLVEDFERRYRVRRSPNTGSDAESVLSDDSIARVLSMEPVLSAPRPTDGSQIVSARLGAAALNCVKHLNLMGCALESIPDLAALSDQLEVLVLSYNSIQCVSRALLGLSKLRDLDLSFNQLTQLEHLEQCEALTTLEVNNNQLQSFDDVEYLGRTFRGRALRHVDLRKNALCDTKRYRLHVLQHLPALESLDQQSVTKDETLAAQQLVTKLSAAKIWDLFYRMHAMSMAVAAVSSSEVSTTSASPHEHARGSTNSINTPERDGDDGDGSAARSPAAPASLSALQPCWNALEELALNRELISEIEGLEHATNLRIAKFADNVITRISGLDQCVKLEELSLEDNAIAKIESLDALVALKKLHLGRNRISVIERLETLANLTQLSLEENVITSLRGLGAALKLMELYIGNNRIDVLKEIQHLKTLPKLTILDLSGNDLTRLPDYRLYTVYYLRRVKVLDGVSISPQDQSDAKQKYSGKLTIEFIADKCAGGGTGSSGTGSSLDRIQDMDLSSCRIRELGSIPGRVFANVRELNLENNQISDIAGLETLPKLRVLNLSRNRIERLLPTSTATTFTVPDELDGRGILACLHLEQLYLAYNQISDMTALGLQYLDDLKVLHLQGNAIAFFAGLDSNTELRELHLDKNRIRQLDVNSTVALRQLRVLTMVDNGLKSLANFSSMLSLEILDLSSNRLIDLDEVECLANIHTLVDLRLMSNPVTKKHLYRQTVLYKLMSVKSLDGREVSLDERERVAVLFVHERAAAAMLSASLASASAYSSINNSSAGSNNAGDRYIETRSYGTNVQITLTPSSIPSKSSVGSANTVIVGSSSAMRATIPQLSTGEVLSGSLLRKHPLPSAVVQSQNQQQQQLQSVSSFPKSDHATESGIPIAPCNTTTRNLLSHTQVASYRNPNSLTNQSNAMLLGSQGPMSPSSTVTVASVLGPSLTGGLPTDPFHLGGLRSDRRRMSSVHYDQSSNATQVGTSSAASPFSGSPGALSIGGGELKLPVGIVSSLAVIRGPASMSEQGAPMTHHYQQQHPSPADDALPSGSSSVLKPTPASLGMATAARHFPVAAAAADSSATTQSSRTLSGYAASSFANQKRYPAYQDFQPEMTIPYFSTKLTQNPHGRPR